MRCFAAVILIFLGSASCDPRLPSEPDVFVHFEFIDAPTTNLADSCRLVMNGVYDVVEGSDVFGHQVVGKWIGNRWCIFSQHDAVYSENAGGSLGDSVGSTIKLYGYYRNVRAGSGARLTLIIDPGEGATGIMSGDTLTQSIRIAGKIENRQKVEFRWMRKLNRKPYHILAHRGGGRNADRLGISENSLPMIQFAATLGATGIEIDVKRTRDNKLIVFHDDSFSPRTVQGSYLLGKVENFDLEQIKLLGRLVYGEQIPTLSEALDAVVKTTELSLVWLDVKDPGSVAAAVTIQKQALASAAAKNRNLEILLGIPSDEVLNAYRNLSPADKTPVLVELEANKAVTLPSLRAWAPIWTREVEDEIPLISDSVRVFVWTVDLRESIVGFLDRERFNGILSNYPTLVAALHYSR